MTARWRKQPNETGLRAVGQGPRGYELRENGEVLIHVSADGGNWARKLNGWYWYGFDVNTIRIKPHFKTAEDAKADAHAFYLARTKERKP